MFIIPIQELDEIVNDLFGNGDAQTQSTNDEAELQEQPRTDDVVWPMGLLFIKTSPVKQNSYQSDFSGVFDALYQSFLVIYLMPSLVFVFCSYLVSLAG